MRKYRKPILNVEHFTANEFIAACHDKNTVYKFTCDAPRGTLYYYPRNDGNIDGVHDANDYKRRLGSYHPCDEKHEASTTADFYDGFVDYNGNRRQDIGEGVIVWRGRWNNNGHATTNLNMSTWETAKS